MKYEIVNLDQKTVVGISGFTSNEDPRMQAVIGGLWERLYQGGVSAGIRNKVNEYAIGLYSDYSKDGYCVTVGNEVSEAENEDLAVKTIPAGKYAKFSVRGHMQKAVAEAWGEIWKLDLARSFAADFEEYRSADPENAEIDIYVSLR